MKQGRAMGVLLAVVNAILIIICIFLYLRTDRIAPEIQFHESQIVYREEGNQDRLLEGVSARDNVDGDITDKIVIEKIVEDRENMSVVVYYAVSDSSGNVAKASRVFDAIYMEQEERQTGPFMKAGIDAEMSLPEKVETVTKDNRTEEEPAEIESKNTPVPVETPRKTPEPAAPEAPSPEPAQSVPTADPSVPILILRTSEVKVKAGQGPAWVDLIGTLSDDKDSYETLFRNLGVSKYDKDKAGSYAVNVYTEDSDGNRSESVPLTIIVE